MLKKLLIVLAIVALFVTPFAARWLYYYGGVSSPRSVPRPDLSKVAAIAPEMPAFADKPTVTDAQTGTILVDHAHDNRFQVGELNVLKARLAARGQRMELLESADDLAGRLRYAQSLAIIAPGTSPSAQEIEAIKAFIDKGGRLLLVADPTRYSILLDDYGDFAGLDSDSSHINDLAAQFGVVFQPDYLYNTVENEGNFRNIRLTDIASNTLSAGLEQVVFYGAHSLLAHEPALISAGGDTRSSSSERAEVLPVAVLAGGGSVLALGDLTFMTEPYNASYDNDRLVANIADFMAGSERSYDLADFPFFFRESVDLVYAGDPLLDTDLIKGGGTLQALFEKNDRVLSVRETEDTQRDTLFFGLYHEAQDVQPYLDAAGVTLVISATATPEQDAPGASPVATLAATPTLTVTSQITPSREITLTAEISRTSGSQAEVEEVGSVVLSGTAVLLLQADGDRHVLVVMASTETGLDNALKRLSEGDLAGCMLQETDSPTTVLALCPTGEVKAGQGTGGWEIEKTGPANTELPTPAPTPTITTQKPITQPVIITKGTVVIVALDDTKSRYDGLTGAADFAAILKGEYAVTTWSEAKNGAPSLADLSGYDLVIWAAGDFEEPFGEDESRTLLGLMMDEVPMIISGAFFNQDVKDALQRDVRVELADHPVMNGFTKDQVIDFVPAPSGKDYTVNIMDTSASEGAKALLVRGPASESPGAPSLVTLEEAGTPLRILYIGFPIYLLPEEPKARLVLNAVVWILSD